MRHLIRTLLLGALLLAFAAPAGARPYVVHSCKLPDGRSAPTDGWSANGVAPYMWFEDACAGGGALRAGLAGSYQPANTGVIGWGFDSGAAAIQSYRIVRSGTPRGFNGGASMLLYSSDVANMTAYGYAIDYCAAYVGCNGVSGLLQRSVPKIPADSHGWFLSLVCGGHAGEVCPLASGSTSFGDLRIDSASFTLDDVDAPQVSALEGSLTTPGAISGSLSLQAADATSGVRRATIELDGQELVAVTPDSNSGRCAEVGLAGGLPDFTWRRPCPASTRVELELPAGLLLPGRHQLRARVYDAAGNGVTAFGPRTLEVARGDVQAAAASARFAAEHGRRMLASYGRHLRIAGTLRANSGESLPETEIEIRLRSAAAVTKLRTIRLRTDAHGRYATSIRATSSRVVELRHGPSGAGYDQRLTVRSRLRLKALRSRVPALGLMRLRGSFASERARRGSSFAIKVRSGGGWRSIGIARSDTRGRFTFRYRFRHTRRGSFVFRAVPLKSSDLAVSLKPSNRIRVRVG